MFGVNVHGEEKKQQKQTARNTAKTKQFCFFPHFFYKQWTVGDRWPIVGYVGMNGDGVPDSKSITVY